MIKSRAVYIIPVLLAFSTVKQNHLSQQQKQTAMITEALPLRRDLGDPRPPLALTHSPLEPEEHFPQPQAWSNKPELHFI